MKKETPLASQKVYQWNIWLRPKFFFLKVSSTFIIPRLCLLSRCSPVKEKNLFPENWVLLLLFSLSQVLPLTLSLEPHSQRKIKLSHLEQGGESPLFLLSASVSEKEDRPIENWFFPGFFYFLAYSLFKMWYEIIFHFCYFANTISDIWFRSNIIGRTRHCAWGQKCT